MFAGIGPQLYDRLMVPMIFTPYARDLAQRIKSHRPRDLLEIAAGTGAVTTVLAAELPDTRITATDLNEPMLGAGENAPRRQRKRQLAAGRRAVAAVRRCELRYRRLPVRRDVLPRPVKGYAEARRAIGPDGRFFFNVWDKIAENDFADVMQQTMHQVFPDNPPQFMARTPHASPRPGPHPR